MKKTFAIAAGGTGGHIYPALALAQVLRERGHEVVFFTRRADAASRLFASVVLPTVGMEIFPFLGQNPLRILKNLVYLVRAWVECKSTLRKLKPSAVIAFGAYVSVPVVRAAQSLNIPVLLHEQNPDPGWATKLCARWARQVAVSFPETQKFFKGRAVLVGNLLRPELLKLEKAKFAGARKNIFVFGGSLGARGINEAVRKILPQLKDYTEKISWFHISGSQEQSQTLRSAYTQAGFEFRVEDYYSDIWHAYRTADLVICRAGATTISELIAVRCPAVLVPYPHAGAHQKANAQVLLDLQAAVMWEEFSPASDLAGAIKDLALEHPEKLNEMTANYEKFPVDLRRSPQKMAELAEAL